MSQSPPNTIQLQSMGSQGTLAPLPQPPDVQIPPLTLGLSCVGLPGPQLSSGSAGRSAEVPGFLLAEEGVWRV